jgi:hypothetical protein
MHGSVLRLVITIGILKTEGRRLRRGERCKGTTKKFYGLIQPQMGKMKNYDPSGGGHEWRSQQSMNKPNADV